jgi:alkylation response protein AidB-like acyl-CoA dehydrogenase
MYSDATNISSTIIYDAKTNEYVINGRKWWISGAGDPRCKISIFLGRTPNPKKKKHEVLSNTKL